MKDVDAIPVPDLAEEAEIAPDALSATVTLRTDAKFHNVAPVSGRAVTADDAAYSWKRFTDPKNTNAAQVRYVSVHSRPGDGCAWPWVASGERVQKRPNRLAKRSQALLGGESAVSEHKNDTFGALRFSERLPDGGTPVTLSSLCQTPRT